MVCQESMYTVYTFFLLQDARRMPNSNFFTHNCEEILFLFWIKRGFVFLKSTKIKQWIENIF